jgi:hypothetical protein
LVALGHTPGFLHLALRFIDRLTELLEQGVEVPLLLLIDALMQALINTSRVA